MSIPKTWLDVTDDLPINVKVGQILRFDYEGTSIVLKIVSKKHGKIWARYLDPHKYLTPEEADEQVLVTPKNL
jgi:hypothetical protein